MIIYYIDENSLLKSISNTKKLETFKKTNKYLYYNDSEKDLFHNKF